MDPFSIDGHVHPPKVFLWATPRSLSTVITKCVSFVEDIQIWFEPYSYAYGNQLVNEINYSEKYGKMVNFWKRHLQDQSENGNPGMLGQSETWIEENQITYRWIKTQLEKPELAKRYTFIKDFPYSINGDLDCEFLPGVKCLHTFIIRNPLYLYPSFKKTITVDPDFNQAPFESKVTANTNIINDYPFFPVKNYYLMHRLWKAVGSIQGCNPIVIDADELSRRPKILLRKYLKAVGFPWKEQFLTWDAGKKITHGWRASLERMDSTRKTWELWYQRALESSTFIPNTKPLPSIESLTPDLQECVSRAMPYYEAMYETRMKVLA